MSVFFAYDSNYVLRLCMNLWSTDNTMVHLYYYEWEKLQHAMQSCRVTSNASNPINT